MAFSPIGYAHSIPSINTTQLSQSPGIPHMPVGCDPLVGSAAQTFLNSYPSGLSTTEQHLQAVAGLYAPYAASGGGRFGLSGPDPTGFYMHNVATQQGYPHSASVVAAAAWRGAAAASAAHQAFQPSSCAGYPYDPNSAAAAWHSAAYAYPTNPSVHDLNGQRRKNATRESTTTLKAWLTEHKNNPYPTKGEKIMLAIITKMTLTQVSTWFANARRRLKKDNKMTWSPRNRGEGEDENCAVEDEDSEDEDIKSSDSLAIIAEKLDAKLINYSSSEEVSNCAANLNHYSLDHVGATDDTSFPLLQTDACQTTSASHLSQLTSSPACCRVTDVNRTPKIWSLAYTATSCSPPPAPKKLCTTPTLPPAGLSVFN